MWVLKSLSRARNYFGGLHKLRSQDLAHYWPPTQPLLTFVKEFLYWNKKNLHTVDISSPTYQYLPHFFNVVCECPPTQMIDNVNDSIASAWENLDTYLSTSWSTLPRCCIIYRTFSMYGDSFSSSVSCKRFLLTAGKISKTLICPWIIDEVH